MSKECVACRTVQADEMPHCGACGYQEFRAILKSRFTYDAIAAFIGVMAVILFWLGRP
jgi:hypothetical protein